MSIPKDTLGISGEFAVASELCRRGIYAQLTLGLRKRTDLLVETNNNMLRIQVKAKQGREWPNCKGIYGSNIFLVFVDFENKKDTDRPDFYILDPQDWLNLVNQVAGTYISSGFVQINQYNTPIWVNQKNKAGKSYEGMGVKSQHLQQCTNGLYLYKERWDKIK